MKYAQMRRHMAYEALTLQGIMALIAYLIRMWPLLVLIAIGILIAGLELLFWSNQSVEPIEPVSRLPEPSAKPSERDAQVMAYHAIQMRVTQFLREVFPDVRWVWESPRAQEEILAGNPVYVLLNRAGGYRRAQVLFQNLQVVGVLVESVPTSSEPAPNTDPGDNTPIPQSDAESAETDSVPEDYGLMAFQWVETHIMELNARCNEAIAQRASSFLLNAEMLPAKESWQDICKELERNELPGAACREEGILIKI